MKGLAIYKPKCVLITNPQPGSKVLKEEIDKLKLKNAILDAEKYSKKCERNIAVFKNNLGVYLWWEYDFIAPELLPSVVYVIIPRLLKRSKNPKCNRV